MSTGNPDELVYHITMLNDWQSALKVGTYSADSLDTEGFIHCSYRSQVERSMNKYYAHADSVQLLHIDPSILNSELRSEASAGDMFPHVYGAINLEAVVKTELVERNANGAYEYK